MRRCRVRRLQDTARKNMRKWRQLPPQVRAKGRVAETVSLLSAVSYSLHLCLSAVPALIGVLGAAQFRVIVFCGTTVHLFKTPKHQGVPRQTTGCHSASAPLPPRAGGKGALLLNFWCVVRFGVHAARIVAVNRASGRCVARLPSARALRFHRSLLRRTAPLLHAKTTRLLPLHTVVRCALSARTRARALSRPTAPPSMLLHARTLLLLG